MCEKCRSCIFWWTFTAERITHLFAHVVSNFLGLFFNPTKELLTLLRNLLDDIQEVWDGLNCLNDTTEELGSHHDYPTVEWHSIQAEGMFDLTLHQLESPHQGFSDVVTKLVVLVVRSMLLLVMSSMFATVFAGALWGRHRDFRLMFNARNLKSRSCG